MEAAETPHLYRPEHAPRTGPMTTLGVGLGVLVHGMFNRARKRPAGYQPWYFVINGVVGGALLYYTARVYDDVTDTMDKRYSGYARVPGWLHDQLSPAQLGGCRAIRAQCMLLALRDPLARLMEQEFVSDLSLSLTFAVYCSVGEASRDREDHVREVRRAREDRGGRVRGAPQDKSSGAGRGGSGTNHTSAVVQWDEGP